MNLGAIAGALNPVGLIGTVGAGLLGGGLDYLGQREQRRADQASAREQMDFQRDMSNTAHQREVADLKAAGLNPVLSANSGASTPVGASIDAENLLSGVQPAISTAMSVAKLKADLANTQANTRKTNAEATHTETDVPLHQKEQGLMNKIWDFFSSTWDSTAKEKAKSNFNRFEQRDDLETGSFGDRPRVYQNH